jgi:hypothetical protein
MKAVSASSLVVLLVVATFGVACSQSESEKSGTQTTLSIAQGDDLSQRALTILNQKCTVCHGAERFEARAFSPEEWNRVIESMVAKGANLSGDEMDVLRHWRGTK